MWVGRGVGGHRWIIRILSLDMLVDYVCVCVCVCDCFRGTIKAKGNMLYSPFPPWKMGIAMVKGLYLLNCLRLSSTKYSNKAGMKSVSPLNYFFLSFNFSIL